MPNRSQPETSSTTPEEEYTSAMRIVGGIGWGTLLSMTVGSAMVLIPQVPRSWLWVVLPMWGGLSALGILLQWSIARGECPKCGHPQSVPALGRRCPNCRTYLKAVNRKIIRI